MLRNLSFWHMLILLAVVVLVFGVKRLPEIGSGLGKSIREFKRTIRDEDEIEDTSSDGEPKRLSD